jgi:hypothetical protein
LQDAYPDSFEKIKEITNEEFATLAEAFKAKASGQSFLAPSSTINLPTEHQQAIIGGTQSALNEFMGCYTLALEQITSALAYTAAKASVSNFVEIHSAVVKDGLEDYLDEFAGEFTTAAHSITEVSATDFLSQRGITPRQRNASKAVEEILSLAPNI